jgi:xanthine dehydrogenase YagS FAD-binding subunit
MNSFQYVSASTPDEAISLIGKNGRYLGGGIDLLDEMKAYIVSPDVLVNVKEIPSAIQFVDRVNPDANGHATISATATIAELASNKTLADSLPGLCDAASEVGSPQIRNVATLAGNLLQHSRCLYYRQPDISCLKRGGSTCYGQDGENKYLSLFSGNACISPIVSSMSVILAALDAKATVTQAGKSKSLSMHELYEAAWKNAVNHNSLKPEDFLVSIVIPLKRQRSAYLQVSEKNAFDWALVSCAAAGNVTSGAITEGAITDARVVLGAVAPVPYMVEEANKFLEGKPLNDDTASKAADIILKDAKPLAQNGYKVPLAHALIRRTLLALNA